VFAPASTSKANQRCLRERTNGCGREQRELETLMLKS
jgi:hypothetical protein